MQTQDAIAERALALGVIAFRSQCENGITYRQEVGVREQFRQLGQNLLDWVRDEKIERFLSASERELHEKDLGTWSHGEIAERCWRIESLKAVLWCIRVLDEMPTYFEVVEVNETYNRLPIGADVAEFLARANLRDQAAVEKERLFAQYLNWRCRTELFRQQGLQPPAGDSYEKVVARSLPAADEGFPIEHDGVDILVNGVRFIDLGDKKADMMSICYERHLALEWVLRDLDWDDAYADT